MKDVITADKAFGSLSHGFVPFDEIKDWLSDCAAKKRIPVGCKTVIPVIFPYYLGDGAYASANVSRYAVPRDYHAVAGGILSDVCRRLIELFPANSFEPFIDNSPFPEVLAAAKAGLGVIGTNGLLITPRYGSWVFIGEIATDAAFAASVCESARCIECMKCVAACPANALKPGGFEPERCLSFITQKKGELTAEETELVKKSGCAWGCDVCQTVCPMNLNAGVTPLSEFRINTVLRVTPGDFSSERAFAWRGEKVIRRNLSIINKEKEPEL